jgi:hypothetical protein
MNCSEFNFWKNCQAESAKETLSSAYTKEKSNKKTQANKGNWGFFKKEDA